MDNFGQKRPASDGAVKGKRGRPKKKPEYNKEESIQKLLQKAVELVEEPFDDRIYRTEEAPSLRDVAKKMNISPNKIETFLSAYTKTISIENGIEKSDGKDLNVADILADETTLVSENIEFEGLKNDIENVISTLKDREQEVVKMRYGLGDGDKYTLEEIGNIYGVTKECIRQTELRALRKMKTVGEEILSCYIF